MDDIDLTHLLSDQQKQALQDEYDRERKVVVMNKYVCRQGHYTITTGTISKCGSCGGSVSKV